MQLKNQLLTQTIKLEIPKEIVHKIQKLCSIISTVEWSGILMYTMEGTFEKPEDVILTVKDIIPMHKGDGASTGFKYNERKRDNSGISDRHIDYVTENEEAETWRLGLIHSHHNMNTYFSPVDIEELVENTPTYINFLSLIVNNRMEFEARVSFMGVAEGVVETTYTALNEFGEPYQLAPTKVKAKIEKMFMYPCEILCDTSNNPYENLFDKAISEILAEKDKPKPKIVSFPNPKPYFNVPKNIGKEDNQEKINNFNPNLSRIERTDTLQFEEGLYEEHIINLIKEYLVRDDQDTYDFTLADLIHQYTLEDYPLDFVAFLFNEIMNADEQEEPYTEEEILEMATESLNIFEHFETNFPQLATNIMLLKKFINELTTKDGRTTN